MSEILAPIEPWKIWYGWQVMLQQRPLVCTHSNAGLLVTEAAASCTPPADKFREILSAPAGARPGDLFDSWRGRWTAVLSRVDTWVDLLKYERISQNYANWDTHFVVMPYHWLGLKSWAKMRRPFLHIVPLDSTHMLGARLLNTPDEQTTINWQAIQIPAGQIRSAWCKSKNE